LTASYHFIISIYLFLVHIMTRDSISKESDIIKIENAAPNENANYLQQYPLLANKDEDELKLLNKAVLKKLNWRFLPCITVMLLMK
jgi:hypothetical protein